MNSSFSEQIFESLLEEAVGGKTPPDLKAKILRAWQDERSSISNGQQGAGEAASRPLIVAELVASNPQSDTDEFDARPIRAGSPVVDDVAKVLQSKAPTERASATPRRNFSSPAVRALLSLSAVGLLALVGWPLLSKLAGTGAENTANLDSASGTAGQDAAAQDVTIPPENSSRPSAEVNGPQLVDSSNSSTSVQSERLDLADLPFVAEKPQLADKRSLNTDRESVPSAPDQQVVAALNERMHSLWDDLGVEPTAAEEDTVLLNKWNRQFDAKSPAESSNRVASLQRLVQTPGFAKSIAQHFADEWLGKRLAGGKQGQELRGYLQSSIFRGHSFADVSYTLLGSDMSDGAPASVLVGRLAGNGNHKLAQSVGANFMDANLACAQCHDSHSAASLTSDLATQENYWSLIAMLKGIEASQQDGKRIVVDNQQSLFTKKKSPTAFFDLPDGRMRAASAVLPSGSDWKQTGEPSPRRSLANWIASSDAFDRAIVNQTWAFLAGRPLVPQVAVADLAGLDERKRLQQKLAIEFRASGHDVRRLAVWILASDVMNRQLPQASVEQVRVADRATLDAFKLRQAVFAAPAPESQHLNFEQNIRIVRSFRGDRDSITLAQPDLLRLPTRKKQAAETTQALPMSFAVHGERPTPRTEQYVDVLLRSQRLSWSERVRHIVLLNPQVTGDARIQFLAQTLLQQHNGDAKAALMDLVWSVTSAK